MTRVEVRLASEYGIMFLYDTSVRPNFPSYAGKSGITYTDTCIAFSVLSYVDGDAVVILTDAHSDTASQKNYTGTVVCPSRSISLFDTSNRSIVSLPLTDVFAQVSVRISESVNPDTVECVIDNIDLF